MASFTYTQHFIKWPHWMIQFYSENAIFCMLKKFNSDLIQALMAYSANMIRSLFYSLKKILNFVTSFVLFSLLEKCPNTEFFLVRLSRIRTEYGILFRSVFSRIWTEYLGNFHAVSWYFFLWYSLCISGFSCYLFFDILFVFLDFTCTLLLMFYFIF